MMMNKIIVLFLFIFTTLFVSSVVCGNELDINNDGIEDLRLEIENGYLIEYGDFNFDGKPDRKTKYNKDDVIIYVEYDQNFNGFMETHDYLVDGLVVRSEIDFDEDGEIDTIFLYGKKEKKCLAKASKPNKTIERTIFKYSYPEQTSVTLLEGDSDLIKQLSDACEGFE